MKKILALVLALMLVLALCACSSAGSEAPAEEEAPAADEAVAEEAAAEEAAEVAEEAEEAGDASGEMASGEMASGEMAASDEPSDEASDEASGEASGEKLASDFDCEVEIDGETVIAHYEDTDNGDQETKSFVITVADFNLVIEGTIDKGVWTAASGDEADQDVCNQVQTAFESSNTIGG